MSVLSIASVEIDAPFGVIGLWDQKAYTPPAPSASREFIAQLRDSAAEGRLFFIDAEDPVRYRMEVVLDTELPSGFREKFETRSGSFRLDAPNGELGIAAVPVGPVTQISVPPGSYVVTPYVPKEFDVARHDRDMQQRVGTSNWRFRQQVRALGAWGCASLLLLAVILLIPFTRRSWPISVPLLLFPTGLHFVLSRTSRYRSVEQARVAYETSDPHVILLLGQSPVGAQIPGGWTPGL